MIAYQRPPTAFVVYFDTSALAEDFHLRRNELANLGQLASAFGIMLKISEVVVREHLNRYGETLGESIARTNNQVASLQRLVHHDDEIAYVAASKATLLQEHEARLRRRLHALGIEVLPIPNVSHGDVVNRALARRKPFDDKGHNGYRDALIWEGLVEELQRIDAGIKIVFVVANYKDFLDASRKKLHADLVEDLVDLGIDPGRVIIANDIGQFNDAFLITPDDQHGQEIITEYGLSLPSLRKFVQEEIGSEGLFQFFAPGVLKVPFGNWDEEDLLKGTKFNSVIWARIVGIQEFQRFDVVGYRGVLGQSLWLKVKYRIRARFEITYSDPKYMHEFADLGVEINWPRMLLSRDADLEISVNYDLATNTGIQADVERISILPETT